MSSAIAVLGGDRRELRIAERLADDGHVVRVFGLNLAQVPQEWRAPTLAAAVAEARWIVCPSPGLGPNDTVYAPTGTEAIILDQDLLGRSRTADGGLVLGRATPTVTAAAAALGIAVFEMKDDRSIAVSNATAVAEAIVRLIIEETDRVLAEHTMRILGYGATGVALLDRLLGLTCAVEVAARRSDSLARIRQRGGTPIPFEDRLAGPAPQILVNTVPDVNAVPASAFPMLAGTLVIDIASPPGGMNHEAAEAAGLRRIWARGLAGARAPVSAGDAQYRFVTAAMATRTATAPVNQRAPHDDNTRPVTAGEQRLRSAE